MNNFREKYLVDENGKQIAVVLDLADYKKLLEELEELDALRAYDKAKASEDEIIPFAQAINELELERRQ
jgi:PHD/YefM family antitoxin component YafN of YafNO toxin-antitoxin module